ncbi:PREDICTED: carbohydrate sulfotransferase 14-like [Amphimedon queenslandica]|uniref:Carbohydrate sulfotransferase n=2 Tax=Amphimedon queenslandica TaxID=400682 RepID=A0AAN0INR3_AMPQE|nr:PREDICTED: carbohydrate sulfotransferase 14-like [Amphimedon queenslandica]|eukprot:XP_011405876.1 PREDICTED: carbohydrate sulfotransferase 14-like [Amphimedon queenslandica]
MSLVKRLFTIIILLSIFSLFILTLFRNYGKKKRPEVDLLLVQSLLIAKDIIKSRGHMVERVQEIPDVLLTTNSSGNKPSNFPDVVARSEWQQETMSNYCLGINGSLLNYSREQNEMLYKHLIYNDKYGIIYCVVPKIGCTKMKLLFVLLEEHYTLEDLLVRNLSVSHKSHLRNVKTLWELSATKREARMRSYYKYMPVRDPLERLVSSYLNKISRRNMRSKFFLNLRQDIIREFRLPSDTNKNASDDIDSMVPTFKEFVQYFIEYRHLMDNHFQPMLDICQPCLVKYDFYPNFHSLSYDMDYILQVFGIPRDFYFNDVRIGASLMPKPAAQFNYSSYYDQIDENIRAKLIEKLKPDMQFYHQLYPRMQKYYS